MKHHIYIFLAFAILLLASCGKNRAPDFDGTESQLVLSACEAISEGRDQDALNLLNELRQYPSSSSFVEEAQLAVRRHYNASQINRMLHSRDLRKLKGFLMEAEKKGVLSGSMLLNSEVPDALEALMLFCAKMPWEHSVALENALSQLAPYVETLSTTKTFSAFYAEQLQLLKKMQQQEFQAKINGLLDTLDRAAATSNADAWLQARNELHKLKPNLEFFRMELQLGTQPTTPNANWSMYAIALMGNWKRLNAKQRKVALDSFPGRTKTNLCSGIILTMKSNTCEALEAHGKAMKELGLPPSNDAVLHYIESLDIKYQGAGRTYSPALGLKEIFSLFSSITINPKR